MNDRVRQIAKSIWSAGDVYIGPNVVSLEAFYHAVRNEALEQSAAVCDEQASESDCPERAFYYAELIRALKEF